MKIQFKTPYQKEPERIGGVKIPYAKGKRKVAQWRWYLIVLIVSSPLIYLLLKVLLSQIIVTAPGYLSLEKVPINSDATGIVSKIFISAGTEVTKNQPLVDLYNPELQERTVILKAELDVFREQLVHERPKSRPATDTDGSHSLHEQYQLALQMAAYQENYLDDVRFLRKQGAATIAELKQAESAYSSALLAMSRAKREYQEYQTYAQKLSQKAVEPVKRLQAEQEAIQKQIDRLQQRAPYAGRILDILASEGQSVSPGAALMVLGRTEKPSIQCYLDPEYAKYGQKGSRAQIKFPDGSIEKVVVREDAKLVKRLSADLAAPIGSRNLLLVPLELLGQVAVEKRIDGLPVTVRFELKL